MIKNNSSKPSQRLLSLIANGFNSGKFRSTAAALIMVSCSQVPTASAATASPSNRSTKARTGKKVHVRAFPQQH